MRYLFGFLCVCTLSVVPLVGCGETGGTGGGGTGGMPECQSPEDCDDDQECTTDTCADGRCEVAPVEDGTACDESNECTVGTCAGGTCDSTPVADDTACGDEAGTCQRGSCEVACTEQGILDAIAAGGGPYTFDCEGPQTVMTGTRIVIDKDVILDGGGNLTVDADEGLVVNEAVAAELIGLAVTGSECLDPLSPCNDGIKNAGGTLTLRNSAVSGNAGDGIVNEGIMTLSECTVSDNSGLGIYNSHVGTLAVMNTAVSGNDDGGIDNDGVAVVINSTISGNTASRGGGIFNEGSLMLLHSTLSGNSAEDGDALSTGPRPDPKYMTTIASTLIEGDCENEQPVTSNGYNIESPGDTCGFDQSTDMPGVSADDLKLGELADNGGPTKTHALEAGSEAIDVIPQADCRVTSDQRGELRPETSRGICDVGAFERQADDQ